VLFEGGYKMNNYTEYEKTWKLLQELIEKKLIKG